MKTSIKFELAILHMTHVMAHTEGGAVEMERKVIQSIREAENISDAVFQAFEASLLRATDQIIYDRSIALLSQCTEGEKLRISTQLNNLWKSNSNLDFNKIRSMFDLVSLPKVNYRPPMTRVSVMI